MGNVQNFLDSTQIMILKVQMITGSLLFIFAGFAAFFELYYVFSLHKKRYFGYCMISIAACITGLITTVFSTAVVVFSSLFFAV